MEDSPSSSDSENHSYEMDEMIKNSTQIANGNPKLYRLKTTLDSLDQSKPYRKITFGEKDTNKPQKTILMVGETGTGKTTLINTMINYISGVQRKDKVWFEITDDQSDKSSAHSQTSTITVYGVYLQHSSVDYTIIDTPGYGGTRGANLDKEIARSLLHLCSSHIVHKIDAVCLVIMAYQNRLSDRQRYIFDAVQSLFGKDVVENIVLLLTHSTGVPPKNALKAIKEAKIKCAVDERNQPVYFLFDNCQAETIDEEYQAIQDQSWNLSYRGTEGLFKFLDKIKPKTLQMTQDVLKKWKQLEANISNLQTRVQMIEHKENEVKQTQEALEKNRKDVEENNNFEYEVEVPYKEKVDINPGLAKAATCCTICEENCHYPDCWWVKDLSWCSVMKNDHCLLCTNKCHYTEHVREAKIYVTKTKTEKRSYDNLKKEYDEKIKDGVSLINNLKEELQKLESEKSKLVIEAFHCVESLQSIALNTESLFILQNIDFLTENLKETNEPQKAEALENIKKRAGEEEKAALKSLTNILCV